jgi:hypothetical protein
LNDISVKQALAIPLLLLAAMATVAAAIGSISGVDGRQVFTPYVLTWASSTLMAVLIWIFFEVLRLAPTRANQPLRIVAGRLVERHQLFLLPALIYPLFLGSYTWAKCSIPFVVGYGWERIWANTDRLIFGADAWTLAHALSPPSLAPAWTLFYAVIWGFALVFSATLIVSFGTRRLTATFFSALMMSWLIGGVLLAYLLSAAGPVFAHLADPTLGPRFAPLRADLLNVLGEDNLVVRSQRYLAAGMNLRIAPKGGGISAMPSMHIATATIFVLAARGTKWIWPAIIFLLMIFFGSVYVGYHYAIDAPVAALVSVACWSTVRRIYRDPESEWLNWMRFRRFSRELRLRRQ